MTVVERVPTDLEVFEAKAILLRLQKERELAGIDLPRCLEDFEWFASVGVKTVYTDPVTELRSFKSYPDYPYLRDYFAQLRMSGLLAVPKSRAMLATTHPLIVSLWECFRVWKRGGIWRTAIVRQNALHANELIFRIRQTWEKMPAVLRPTLEIDNLNRLMFSGGGEIRALPEEGETGRGEDWDLVILDEGSHQAHLEENIGAFAARARSIVIPSTYNGEGDPFCRIVDGVGYPGRRIFAMPYWLHPERQDGTEGGAQYLKLQQAKMSEADFKREILMQRDVYEREGYYGSDWRPQVVREFEWDQKSRVTLGMDYSYTNPATVVAFTNDSDQWCRHREYKEVEMSLERYCRKVFEDVKILYPKARFHVAPDPFRGRQTKGDQDAYGEPATDLATISRLAKSILGEETIVTTGTSGRLLRSEGHRRVRRLFAMREDGRYGTVIHPRCVQLIQGFSGAYGPADGATPRQLELEEPDPRRIQVHIMDADRYGVVENVVQDRGLEIRKSKVMEVGRTSHRWELTAPSLRRMNAA